jgi:cytochrome c oxidase subunit 1
MIAKQYLFAGLIFMAIAGAFALGIRWQLARPFEPVPILGHILWPESDAIMPPEFYTMLFTMHGMLMVFFAVTPIVIGAFGNFIIPLQVGARDMAYPVVNTLSIWVLILGGIVVIASFFVPGGAGSAGWTMYAPLSSSTSSTIGWGQTLFVLALALAGTSTLLGAINYIATTLNLRTRGMTMMRLPLTVWGLFYSSILSLLWIPIVAAALFMVLLDRVAGTSFFLSGPLAPYDGGQPLLFQHLFWGFGHPEVYILILPVWGIVGELLSTFSRKPAFGYKATVVSMGVIVALSSVVWGHHMFTAGISPLMGTAFMLLTITISIPTAVFFLNWLGTLWRGSIRLQTPMIFALGIVFVFAIGGLTGLFHALQAFDVYIHDTYFVVGHFHYTLAASVFFGAFAGIYYWFPKMFGRAMNETLGYWHFGLSFILLNCIFFTMMWVGLGGHMRRIADPTQYEFLKPFQGRNEFMGYAALALGFAQLIFVYNFFATLLSRRKAEDNPWQAATLEWSAPTPPPHGNFAELPIVYRGPYEYNSPIDNGRDWIMQNEVEPASAGT